VVRESEDGVDQKFVQEAVHQRENHGVLLFLCKR